jgi:hypothetical protein
MENTYVIVWKSKSRGSVGRGKRLFSREEAEQTARELNEDHPDFIHEPLDLGGPSTTPEVEHELLEPTPAQSFVASPAPEEVFA